MGETFYRMLRYVDNENESEASGKSGNRHSMTGPVGRAINLEQREHLYDSICRGM